MGTKHSAPSLDVASSLGSLSAAKTLFKAPLPAPAPQQEGLHFTHCPGITAVLRYSLAS